MSIFFTTTGFSVEIEGFELVHRGKHNGLPLYESLGGIVTTVALVKDPALESTSIANEQKKTITSPIMIPDKKIYRHDEFATGLKQEYFCFFSVDTIKYLYDTFTGDFKIDH